MAPRFSIWMVLAGVVVGVLGGYLAGSGVIGDGPSDTRTDLASNQGGGKSSRERTGSRVAKSASAMLRDEALRGTDIDELDASEYFDLFVSLSDRMFEAPVDSFERSELDYKTSLLIAQMPGAKIRDLLELMRTSDLGLYKTMRDRIQTRLMRQMIECDPDAAVAWAESVDNGKPWMGLAILGMSQVDPQRAAELLRENVASGNIDLKVGIFDAQYGSAAVANIARHLAQDGLQEFLAFLEWAPDHHNLISFVESAIPEAHIGDFVSEWRRRVDEGEAQSHELRFLMGRWAEVAPDRMKAWFSELEDAGDASVALAESVGHSLMLVDRSDGLAFFEDQFRGDPEWARELYRSRIGFLLYSPERLEEFSDLLPPEVAPTAVDFGEFNGRLLHKPQDIATVANVFRDTQERFRFLEQLLTSESIAESWPSQRPAGRPGPNENDLRSVWVALAELELNEAQRAEVFRMFDAAAFGEGEAAAAE